MGAIHSVSAYTRLLTGGALLPTDDLSDPATVVAPVGGGPQDVHPRHPCGRAA